MYKPSKEHRLMFHQEHETAMIKEAACGTSSIVKSNTTLAGMEIWNAIMVIRVLAARQGHSGSRDWCKHCGLQT